MPKDRRPAGPRPRFPRQKARACARGSWEDALEPKADHGAESYIAGATLPVTGGRPMI